MFLKLARHNLKPIAYILIIVTTLIPVINYQAYRDTPQHQLMSALHHNPSSDCRILLVIHSLSPIAIHSV